MTKTMPKGMYKAAVKEFDICEHSIAEIINNCYTGVKWQNIARGKKIQLLECARKLLIEIEKYYELIPIFWKD